MRNSFHQTVMHHKERQFKSSVHTCLIENLSEVVLYGLFCCAEPQGDLTVLVAPDNKCLIASSTLFGSVARQITPSKSSDIVDQVGPP